MQSYRLNNVFVWLSLTISRERKQTPRFCLKHFKMLEWAFLLLISNPHLLSLETWDGFKQGEIPTVMCSRGLWAEDPIFNWKYIYCSVPSFLQDNRLSRDPSLPHNYKLTGNTKPIFLKRSSNRTQSKYKIWPPRLQAQINYLEYTTDRRPVWCRVDSAFRVL